MLVIDGLKKLKILKRFKNIKINLRDSITK
jgi:hypothetical protein